MNSRVYHMVHRSYRTRRSGPGGWDPIAESDRQQSVIVYPGQLLRLEPLTHHAYQSMELDPLPDPNAERTGPYIRRATRQCEIVAGQRGVRSTKKDTKSTPNVVG
jgi:hypothetical protein